MLKKYCTFALIALIQIACSGTEEVTETPGPGGAKDVSLTPLLHTQHCPITQPGLSVYQSPEAFAQAQQSAPKSRLDLTEGDDYDNEALLTIEPGTWAVAVNLGQKPTAGYGLELQSRAGEFKDGTLTIYLKQIQPSPGTMQATAMTMPCVIVSFAGSMHGIQNIEVKTQKQQWQQATTYAPQKNR